MAKILTFRNKGDAPSGQDFLTDGNQTLSFRKTEDGGIDLGDISRTGLSGLFPDPKKDWSNQELADLFRVRQLLSGANVPVETDRGVTDEGDPWFVFCHANGEVFIHLCRIDGAYVLDSPNVLRPLRGADFNELIADFTNQALPAGSADEESARRVIRLERGGKVRLHPSAMLAALIWTLFLASEELVLLAPEETEAVNDALLDFDGLVAVDIGESMDVDLIFGDDTVDVAHLLKDGELDTLHDAPDIQTQMREAHQGITVHNNAFTMGLSTIAIAMGFMSETVLLNNQRKVLEGLKELGFSEYGDEANKVAELDIPADAEGSALLAMLTEFLGLDLSLNTELAELQTPRSSGTDDKQGLSHFNENITADVDLSTLKTATPAVTRNKDVELDQEDQVLRARTPSEAEDILVPSPSGDDTLSAEGVQNTLTNLTLSEIVQTWQLSMEEFQLGQTTVKASFELSDFDAFALFEMIGASKSERTTTFSEFDTFAQRLIDFIEAKDGDVGVIRLENEIIMIDRTAVSGGDMQYMNWETEDGMVISLVGLASDFQQFEMIA